MTESTATPAPPATKPASFWEDLIDIFVQPADVFRRRENASYWPPLIVLSVVLALFTLANANVLQPIFYAELSCQIAPATKLNAQTTTEIAQRVPSVVGMIQCVVCYGPVVTIR